MRRHFSWKLSEYFTLSFRDRRGNDTFLCFLLTFLLFLPTTEIIPFLEGLLFFNLGILKILYNWYLYRRKNKLVNIYISQQINNKNSSPKNNMRVHRVSTKYWESNSLTFPDSSVIFLHIQKPEGKKNKSGTATSCGTTMMIVFHFKFNQNRIINGKIIKY